MSNYHVMCGRGYCRDKLSSRAAGGSGVDARLCHRESDVSTETIEKLKSYATSARD
jgi:hypothetical protein